jgi:hypothetical protein
MHKNSFHHYLIILALSFPTVVYNQSGYNINILPVGDIESMMANTGTAGLTSTGAVYYNPSALTQLNENSFSLKGTAYTLFNFKADPVAVIGNQRLKYESNGFQSIPTTLIIVKKIKEWRAAFSVIIPMAFNYEGLTSWKIGESEALGELKVLQNYKERMMLIGLSFARKLNDRWSLGISAFGQSYSYLSYLDIKSTLNLDPEFLINNSSRERYNPFNFLFIAGINRTGEKWNLGLRISAPNIYLFGKGEYYYSNYYKPSATDPAEISEFSIENEKAKFETPLDLRIGLVHKSTDKLKLALDLSYTFGIKYDVFDTPLYDNTPNFKASLRTSAGMEYSINNSMYSYFGFSFTPLKSALSTETFEQNFYTGTAGVRFNSKFIKASLGVHYTKGMGTRQFSGNADLVKETYGYLGIFIGTNYVF